MLFNTHLDSLSIKEGGPMCFGETVLFRNNYGTINFFLYYVSFWRAINVLTLFLGFHLAPEWQVQ